MANTIIVVILLAVIVLALLRTKKHFKGGGCCGGGSNTIRSKKELTETIIGEFTLTVEGMHCQNCEIRVENALNRLDGVLCHANYKKNTAVVAYSKIVSCDLVKETVEKLGYQVTNIC